MALRPLIVRSMFLGVVLFSAPLRAQQPTGTITGAITDPSGARISYATLIVAAPSTGFTLEITASSAGVYAVSALRPGRYEMHVYAAGFRQTVVSTDVQVGRTSTIDVQLQVGAASDAITVTNEAVHVDTSATALQGVITDKLIHNLPLNGRNFMELGQLEPGAQVNDGSTLIGVDKFHTVLGVAGQSGILTRVTLDGADITDEHWGSTMVNISQDAIQEFQVSRSALDASAGLTANGAVNVVTKSGSNNLHGSGFLFGRDSALAARIGATAAPFDREQFGVSVGGPLLHDRLFGFASYEQTSQDGAVSTYIPTFSQFSGIWSQPFDESLTLVRLDANVNSHVRLFGRFLYDGLQGIPTGNFFGGDALSPRGVQDNTAQTTAGLEASHGRFTQSVRFAYLRWAGFETDGTALIPGFPRTVDPQGRLLTLVLGSAQVGPNINVPQRRLQDSYESRYDGSYSFGRHALRWGFLDNVIRTNWFEATFNWPDVTAQYTLATQAVCGDQPLCYPIQSLTIGNRLGWYTEVATQGQPFGGFKNHRIHGYVADSWRATPRLTVNAGLRYVYEPGADAPDLIPPAVLEKIAPGLGGPGRRDKNNFAPQLGIAFDPTGQGKWVVRASAGLFYDVKILKDTWWVRNNQIGGGIGNASVGLPNQVLRDPNTNAVIFDIDGSTPAMVTSGCNWLGKPLGAPAGLAPGCNQSLLDAIFQAADLYYAASQAQAANFPAGLSTCERNLTCQAFGPNYRTPYTLQFSVGMQRELRRGLVLSVDFVRHRGLHYLLRREVNRNGAADNLNVANAQAATAATNKFFGCGNSFDLGAIQCAISKGATIEDYAARGLGKSAGARPGVPNPNAFPGDDPTFNALRLHDMTGNSTYNALQVQLRGNLPDLGRHLKNWNVWASYALSRMKGTSEDEALVWLQADDLKQNLYGPTTLDRTHILSVADAFDMPLGLRFNSVWRVMSALPQTIYVPTVGTSQAEIFRTDLDGDGLGGDLLPGTGRGSYGRDIGCGAAALNRYIDGYNQSQAGRLTPAGQTLVTSGLFTESQLTALGAVSPTLARAPAGQVCLDSFITTDVRISRPIKLGERFTLEPALEWFNLFNVANYDMPADKLQGTLTGVAGTLNGTTVANRLNRASYSGGTNSQGAPRSWQLSVRVTF